MSARLTVPYLSLSQQTCAVCLEDFKVKDELGVLPCQHAFHRKWVQESTVGSFSALVTTLRPPARTSWKWKCSCEIRSLGDQDFTQDYWFLAAGRHCRTSCSAAPTFGHFFVLLLFRVRARACTGRREVELVLRSGLLGVLKCSMPIPRCHLQHEEHNRRS